MNLIIGRAGTGKTEEIINRVSKDLKKDEKVYLIIPEQFSYTFERKITDSFSSVLNLQILSFTRLTEQILSDSKYAKKTYLDDISRIIVLEEVLERLDLSILKNKEKNIESISSAIEEFKRYKVRPEDLKEYIELKTRETKNLSLIKIEELAKIYEEYNKSIKDKYLDIADKEFEILDIIEEKEIFKNSKIYISQFSKLTFGEYAIIEKMLKQAAQVNIAITTDTIHMKSAYEVFSPTKKTIADLIRISQQNGVKVNIIEKKVNIKHGQEIKNLELSMVTDEPVLSLENSEKNEESNILEENSGNEEEKLKKNQNITLRVYKNLEDELEDIAEDIKSKIINLNYSFSNIAVIFNDLQNQSDLVRRIFAKHEIPIHLEVNKKLEENSIIRYILELLEIISTNFSIESVFSFLKLKYTDFDINDVYLLENYVLRWDIKGYKWNQEWKNYDGLDPNDFDRIINLKNEFIKFIEDFKSKFNNEITAKEISIEIYNLIEDKKVFESVINEIDLLEIDETRKLELKAENATSLNLLKETLDRIVSIKKDDKITFDEYYRIFKLVISKTEIKKIPAVSDAVHFTTSQSHNIDGIKVLYIASLEDELYPIVPSHRAIINDDEKLNLRSYNINLADTDIEKLSEDEFNLYNILLIPSHFLHLSYHISSFKGGSKRPSIYINKVKRLLKYLEEESRIKGIYKENIVAYSNKVLLDKVLSKYLEILEGKRVEDEWKYLIHFLQKTSEEFREVEKNILDKNIASNLSLDILENMYKNTLHTSVSRLEEYAKCPFSYFSKYILNLYEDRRFQIEYFNTGILLHDVLESIAKKIKLGEIDLKSINSKLPFLSQSEILSLKDGNQEFAKEFEEVNIKIENSINEIIEEKLKLDKFRILSASPKFEFLTNKFKEQILEAGKAVIESMRLSDFEVLDSEIEIDKNFTASRINLNNDKNIQIYGQIDRADILKKDDKTYLQIVDYKSSAHDLDENKVRSGLQIQILTYLDILAKEKKYEPFSALYFGLSPYIQTGSKNTSLAKYKHLDSLYKMKGLIVNDVDIIKLMDKSLEAGYSSIIPVGLKADGELNAYSSVKNVDEFADLRKDINKKVKEMSTNILQGDISIHPYRYKNEVGCRYCPYINICKFDIKKNKYRKIKKDNKKES